MVLDSVTFSDSAPGRESSALCNYRPAHRTSPIFKLSEPQSDEGVTVNRHEHNNRHGSHIHNDDLLSDTREGLVRPVCTQVQKSVSDEGDNGLEYQHEGADLGRVYGDDASRQNSRPGQQEQAERPEQPEQPETEQPGDQEIDHQNDRQRGDNAVVASSSLSASRRAKRKPQGDEVTKAVSSTRKKPHLKMPGRETAQPPQTPKARATTGISDAPFEL